MDEQPPVREIGDRLSLVFDGHGGAREFVAAPEAPPSAPGFVWQHLRRDHPETRDRLAGLGLDHLVIEALTAEETRPRCTVHGHGVLLNLRGVNLHPGAEPEDMISVRLWIEAQRVIGVWARPLQAVQDLLATVERHQAPTSPGDFVARLALRLADRAEPCVAILNEQMDDLEVLVLDPASVIPRADLSALRRRSIILRRYFLPQRDALTSLEIEDLDWLHERDRSRLREAAERTMRLGEDLDAVRDRAQVVHDQVMDRRAERMNRQMLLLAIVAALFLPLGLVTGLLGINVGGIPGADSPLAFWLVCGLLATLAAAMLGLFWRLGMFR